MKIIAGALKGMKILAPRGDDVTRPTSAKVREAILHRFGDSIQEAVFLDFFSGTGAVGIEALSRGAKGCYFIEKDPSVVKILKKNMALAEERLGKQDIYPSPFRVLSSPASKALVSLQKMGSSLPLILWADPPYKDILLWLKTLKKEGAWLLESTDLIILEFSSEHLHHPDVNFLGKERCLEKVYGETAVVAWN